MEQQKEKNLVSSWKFFVLAICAFGGLGLEIVIVLVEMCIYGGSLDEMASWQIWLHWGLTCLSWLTVTIVLMRKAKRKYQFDVLSFKELPTKKAWIGVIIITIMCIIEASVCSTLKQNQSYS